jgi:hypothetical protein
MVALPRRFAVGAAWQATLAVDDDNAWVDALARNVVAGGETESVSPRPHMHGRRVSLPGRDCAAFTRSELISSEPDAVQAPAQAANR